MALNRWKSWEAAIEDWQRPIVEDTSTPRWYRGALLNELYYLAHGGSIWASSTVPVDAVGAGAGRTGADGDASNTGTKSTPAESLAVTVSEEQAKRTAMMVGSNATTTAGCLG